MTKETGLRNRGKIKEHLGAGKGEGRETDTLKLTSYQIEGSATAERDGNKGRAGEYILGRGGRVRISIGGTGCK